MIGVRIRWKPDEHSSLVQEHRKAKFPKAGHSVLILDVPNDPEQQRFECAILAFPDGINGGLITRTPSLPTTFLSILPSMLVRYAGPPVKQASPCNGFPSDLRGVSANNNPNSALDEYRWIIADVAERALRFGRFACFERKAFAININKQHWPLRTEQRFLGLLQCPLTVLRGSAKEQISSPKKERCRNDEANGSKRDRLLSVVAEQKVGRAVLSGSVRLMMFAFAVLDVLSRHRLGWAMTGFVAVLSNTMWGLAKGNAK